VLFDGVAQLAVRDIGCVARNSRPPDRVEQVGTLVVDRSTGEDQPMVLRALENTDRSAQPKQVAMEPQREIVGILAASIRETRDELPFVVDDSPVQ